MLRKEKKMQKATWKLEKQNNLNSTGKGGRVASAGLEKGQKALAPQPGIFYLIWHSLPADLLPVN